VPLDKISRKKFLLTKRELTTQMVTPRSSEENATSNSNRETLIIRKKLRRAVCLKNIMNSMMGKKNKDHHQFTTRMDQ
jgi:hypothetical protein